MAFATGRDETPVANYYSWRLLRRRSDRRTGVVQVLDALRCFVGRFQRRDDATHEQAEADARPYVLGLAGVELERDGQAACSGCGAIDGSTCAGSGTGIWQSVNSSTAPIEVPLSIKGLRAQNVTRVFTNEGSASQKGAPAN